MLNNGLFIYFFFLHRQIDFAYDFVVRLLRFFFFLLIPPVSGGAAAYPMVEFVF